MTTDDKTMTDDAENMERRKRQAENSTETTTSVPGTTPAAEEDAMANHKPGYGAFVYIMLTGVSTIGKDFRIMNSLCPSKRHFKKKLFKIPIKALSF